MRTLKLLALTLLALVFLLITSCDFNSALFANTTGNPFLQNTYALGSLQNLVIVTDVHIGREHHERGITRYDNTFKSFLANTSQPTTYSALISIGDLVDESNSDISVALTFIKRFAPYCSNRFISVIGNHETHTQSMSDWENSFPTTEDINSYFKRMAVYKFENVSIYVMDNAKRLFGYTQLNYLEEAISKDTNEVKIVLAHENVMTGNKLDQSLILFGNPSVTEMARFAKILENNGVSLVLTGHTHNGDIIYRYGNKCFEMNLAAYHAKETALNLEGKGSWYTLSIDQDSKEIVVKTYLAKTGEQIEEHRFSY